MPSRKDDIIGITKSGKWKKEYPTCNQFVCDVSKRFFGMDTPKVGAGDFANNPIGAIHMKKYLGGRSAESDTGVNKVLMEDARNIANAGGLVYVVGNGHVSIAAPSEKSFKMYRSKVGPKGKSLIGLKNPNQWEFYHVDVPKYKQYDAVSPNEYAGDFVTRRGEIANLIKDKKTYGEDSVVVKMDNDRIKSTFDSQVDIGSFVGTPSWRNQQDQIEDLIR